ncbi:MAG TPA: hypothetical protein VNC78_12555 [Actinomycetota bacterium]|nr:hypothetical protein [Actinomycetota bacterium]
MQRVALVLCTCLMLLGVPGAEAKPTQLWEDGVGDTELNASPVPGLDQLGFDLVGGAIEKVGSDLHFSVTHASMPPAGNIPETFRFLWLFDVDGTTYRITYKRADIGKPDIPAGETTERVGRADVEGHFRLEGECANTPTPTPVIFVNCKPLEYVTGSFDAAAKTFTVIIPMASVKAKAGSKVIPGSGEALITCQICWLTHTAERSLAATIVDRAVWATTFKVPKR